MIDMEKLTVITLDFETYYNEKEKYFLKRKNTGLTIEKYVRDPRFEVIGLAYKINNKPTEFLAPHQIQEWLDHIEIAYGWDNVRVVAQNGRFDMAILGWIYNIYPKQVADTMLMARARKYWDGQSLDVITNTLYEKYDWGCYNDQGVIKSGKFADLNLSQSAFRLVKGDEVVSANGKHLMDFTDEEYDAYAEYCRTDVDLTYSAYRWFTEVDGFPEFEIDVMTYTIEMFTYPVLELDEKVLKIVEGDIHAKRNELLAKVGATVEMLRSDDQFAQLLREQGVEPPTKLNDKGQTKYAFAKKDLAFLALLEHENETVVDLVKARLGNKSSQAVTRVKSFIDLSQRGEVPMPLEYYAAHTGRWGGCLTADTMVICLTAEQQVVEKRIVDVLLSDLVWDGVEFVEHEGVKFSGYQEVITYDGITGTKCHPVFINETDTISLLEAMQTGTPIMDCPKPKIG